MSKQTPYILLMTILFVGFNSSAQEGLRPLEGNINYYYKDLGPQEIDPISNQQISKPTSTASLFLPFKDDFSYSYLSNYPNGKLWSDSSVYVNSGFAKAAPSIGVATFDGLNKHGFPHNPSNSNFNASYKADTLISRPINLHLTANSQTLQPTDKIGLSFYYQVAGNGDYPESSDSLLLDFYKPNQREWVNVWYQKGPNPINYNDTNFKRVFIWIKDTAFLQDNFQFKFRNWASTMGDFDHWNLDYVYLDKGRDSIADTSYYDIAFGAMPLPFLKNYSAMPYKQYNALEMAARTSVKIRSNHSSSLNFNYKYLDYFDMNSGIPYTYLSFDNLLPFVKKGYDTTSAIARPKIDSIFKNLSYNYDYPIKHIISLTSTITPQFFSGNDTLVQYQRFRNYYAFDDGNAEAGYYVLGTGGSMAVKVTLNKKDTLLGANIYFSHVGNFSLKQTFTLSVWSAGANGPGNLLLSDTGLVRYIKTGFKTLPTYTFKSSLASRILGPGTYYIGFKQGVATGINVGFDRNFDHHTSLYYDSGSGWNQSVFAGSIMIRPLFGNLNGDPIQLAPLALNEINTNYKKQVLVYPNPSSDWLNVYTENCQNCLLELSNCLGQKVLEQRMEFADCKLNINELNNGVYFLVIKEKGANVHQQKIIISH
jgi:Secretion system C-terminal sorting domain